MDNITLENINSFLPNYLFASWYDLTTPDQTEILTLSKQLFEGYLTTSELTSPQITRALAYQCYYVSENPDIFVTYLNPSIKIAGAVTIDKMEKADVIYKEVFNIIAPYSDYRAQK